MNFVILYKGKTSKGSNYYKLLVEYSTGIWEEATYFGNTIPKEITALYLYKDNWVVEIQKHTSRDSRTGQFKCARAHFAY